MALEEANKALIKGNFPVGAILVIDDKVVAKSQNCINEKDDFFSHAEIRLLKENSQAIKKSYFYNAKIELYCTLEPCLMCYGAILLHRIQTIYISCPDPHGGFSLNNIELKHWYKNKQPILKKGILGNKSLSLILKYLNTRQEESFKKMMILYQSIEF